MPDAVKKEMRTTRITPYTYDVVIDERGAIGVTRWGGARVSMWPTIISVTDDSVTLEGGHTIKLPEAEWVPEAVYRWQCTAADMRELSS